MAKSRRRRRSGPRNGSKITLKQVKSEVNRLRTRVNKLDPSHIAKKAAKEAEESLKAKFG